MSTEATGPDLDAIQAALDAQRAPYPLGLPIMLPSEPPGDVPIEQVLPLGNVYKTWYYLADDGWLDAPPEDLDPEDHVDAITWGTLVGRAIDQRMTLRAKAAG